MNEQKYKFVHTLKRIEDDLTLVEPNLELF